MRVLVISPHLEPDSAPTGVIISAVLEELSQLGLEIHAITSLPWYEKHEVGKSGEVRAYIGFCEQTLKAMEKLLDATHSLFQRNR